MALKRRNKVSAEFSMSSLTDIIFLLLIFFMLTSSLIAPEAINLKLPGINTMPNNTPKEKVKVVIDRNGVYRINGSRTTLSSLNSIIDKKVRQAGSSKNVTMTIEPHPNSPVESVVDVFNMALKENINPVLAAEKFMK